MDRDTRAAAVSPYLLRPLRSMVQAMRDLARARQPETSALAEAKTPDSKMTSEAD